MIPLRLIASQSLRLLFFDLDMGNHVHLPINLPILSANSKEGSLIQQTQTLKSERGSAVCSVGETKVTKVTSDLTNQIAVKKNHALSTSSSRKHPM